MLALNETTEAIAARFGTLTFRLIEDEIVRAIARNDDDAADAWKAKLLEVNSATATVASPSRPIDAPVPSNGRASQ